MKNLLCLVIIFSLFSCTSTRKNITIVNQPIQVEITTDSGIIVVQLFDETPLHRDNFVKLVEENFYDSLLFHRVINHFMIQGGDPNSKNAPAGKMLGDGGLSYTVPAEFDTSLYHKKGALAAAREGDNVNPTKASSSTQFYIVHGKPFSDKELDQVEESFKTKIPTAHREVYRTVGGTPHLDMKYTVFGEVISGLEVIDKIASARTDRNNRPHQDIKMKMTIVKKATRK